MSASTGHRTHSPLTAWPDRRAGPPTASDTSRQADVVLLGPGKVGSTLLQLLSTPAGHGLRLLGLANSRTMLTAGSGVAAREALPRLSVSPTRNDFGALVDFLLDHHRQPPVVVDATASTAVACEHAGWLKRGVHVVTANKTAAAEGWVTPEHGPGHYGDAATVGAGLPILSSIRRLHAAGDRIVCIEGILSGSLAYLFNALETGLNFSAALAEAQNKGYTEPDPRIDLSGIDAARKLAILSRAAGFAPRCVPQPESLIPTAANPSGLAHEDHAWRARIRQANAGGQVLRYIARAEPDGCRVRTEVVDRCSPLAQTRGAGICVAIHSETYRDTPLVISGPGAGAAVTARALLADILDITRQPTATAIAPA